MMFHPYIYHQTADEVVQLPVYHQLPMGIIHFTIQTVL